MKKLLAIIPSFSLYLLGAFPAFAQVGVDPCTDSGGNPISAALCGLTSTNAGTIVRNIVIAMIVIAVVIALFFLIWGGIKWIMSGGDKGAVEGARNTIVAAIVGLIVIFVTVFILTLILGIFGVSLTNLEIPKIVP